MSLWQRLFGRRDLALEEARAAVARGAHEESWAHALRSTAVEARRIASRAARARGALELAVRLDRAADDPADTARLFELAGALVRHGELDAAIRTLEDALTMAPFDAVLRSELALLLARAARPAESAAVLALHPCLADDPGALFQFAWSSLLAGDHRAARACVPQLAAHREASSLAQVLESALDRAELVPRPRDLRDWLFVEHGALLLDASAPRGAANPAEVARVLAPSAADALARLDVRPRRVIAGDDPAHAAPLAQRLGLDVVTARAGIPEGLLVVGDASALERLVPQIAAPADTPTLAWTLSSERGSLVPDLVGTITRAGAATPPLVAPADLREVADARRRHLARGRALRPFALDAPLSR